MVIDNPRAGDARPLLGLRPPADLAEGNGSILPAGGQAATPPRPAYGRVSSGWDSEDQDGRKKGSDLVAALRAGAVLIVVLVGLALLLR